MENLEHAYYMASKGKGYYKDVADMEANPELKRSKLNEIGEKLKANKFHTSKYITMFRKERSKMRRISKLPFYPDRIVQWALMNVIKDRLTKNFTTDTYSSIEGRGVQSMIRKLRTDIHNDPDNCKYVLQIDVHHFYASISKSILKKKYRELIKDKNALWLIDEIIDSYNGDGNKTGLPIGNYTSQFSANLYMSEIDHKIKEEWHAKYYYRYMDDILILGSSKEWLWKIYSNLKKELGKIKLSIKPASSLIYPTKNGISVVGYVIYNNYVKVRNSIKRPLIWQCKYLAMKPLSFFSGHDYGSVKSRTGWLKHADANKLYIKYVYPLEYKLDMYHIQEHLNERNPTTLVVGN